MREISESERKILEDILRQMPSTFRRWMEGVENFIVLWSASLLGLILLWLFSAWIIRIFFHIKFDWNSDLKIWIVSLGALLCGIYSIISSVNWIRNWNDIRPLLRQDLSCGKAIEENISIVEVKRFQEQEHGGLIYFLRSDEDKVFVVYDEESQDRAANGEDPLKSALAVQSLLKIVRAPISNLVIKREFSGSEIELGETLDIFSPPELWPESDSWCTVSWSDLNDYFSERWQN